MPGRMSNPSAKEKMRGGFSERTPDRMPEENARMECRKILARYVHIDIYIYTYACDFG